MVSALPLLFGVMIVLIVGGAPSNQQKIFQNSIENIIINASALTITSIMHNPTTARSEWVDRILGHKSVFQSKHNGNKFLSRKEISFEEITLRNDHMKKRMQLPDYAIWAPCSIELLGFVLLDETKPFTLDDRTVVPAVGTGNLSIGGQLWPCFYRAVYENWRTESMYTKPNFWAVLLFCPPPNLEVSCTDLEAYKEKKLSFPVTVAIKTATAVWNTSFVANNIDRAKVIDKLKELMNPMAVCVSVPYTSTDSDKAIANGAMLAEWIRYHVKLGVKVIVYDRDGANVQYIFNSTYNRAQGVRNENKFVYHPYTIRGLLDPSRKGIRYDNTEIIQYENTTQEVLRRNRYESQGHDKTMTFTQCRFEAKAVYGIDRVLVTDFDEFLYCPIAGPKAKDQARFFAQYVTTKHRLGVDQVMIPQRLVLNRTENQRDCIVEKVKQGHSLFDCFSAYENYFGGHSVKSLHIGLSCPLTGYHQACPGVEAPRAYDCMCNNWHMKANPYRPLDKKLPNRECSVVHLSTNRQNYRTDRYKYTDEEQRLARKSKSELWHIVQEE